MQEELTYSKKQIQPLIDKFAINPATNTIFAKLITMFDGKPNLQVWAIKAVFGKITTVENIENIKNWMEENSNFVKCLSKNGNVVSYSSKNSFKLLEKEIGAICALNFVRRSVKAFNTAQRTLFSQDINLDSITHMEAMSNAKFKKWHDIFVKFSKLPGTKKSNVYTKISSCKDIKNLEALMNNAITSTYSWNREDFLAFIANNAQDCSVVYDKDNIVVIRVTSYESSNRIAQTNTKWCIATSREQWNNYVVRENNKQYFMFDFNLSENDEIARIGFTISKNGLRNAHTVKDEDIKYGITYKSKRTDFNDVLKMRKMEIGLFMTIDKNLNYTWDIDSVVRYIESLGCKVLMNANGIVVTEIKSKVVASSLIGNTFISFGHIDFGSNASKMFVLMDLNRPESDSKSILMMTYAKDKYGIFSMQSFNDALGTSLMKDNYLSNLGITTDMFFKRDDVDPSIMLHKLIDEGDQAGAIKLIENNHDKINVNHELNGNVPVFMAIERRMFDLFTKIVMHEKYNTDMTDAYGESILTNIMYVYYLNTAFNMTAEDAKATRQIMEAIVDCGRFDLNYQNENEDTALSVATNTPALNWLVEKLASRPDINVNLVNDIGCNAIQEALRKKNKDAVKILAKRKDMKFTKDDVETARGLGIDLEKEASASREEQEAVRATLGDTLKSIFS